MSDPVYCYPPDHLVLRNKLNIRDAATLDRAEFRLVSLRMRAGIPQGDFDLNHLKAIHGHLFQDVYEWAGQIRTVEISKDRHQFQTRRFIEIGMADVHKRITAARYFQGLGPDDFAKKIGKIIGDINYVHPFREGNGRTQLQYLKQLASRAGHRLDLQKIDRDRWMEASRQSHGGNYDGMSQSIRDALVPDRSRFQSQTRDRGDDRGR